MQVRSVGREHCPPLSIEHQRHSKSVSVTSLKKFHLHDKRGIRNYSETTHLCGAFTEKESKVIVLVRFFFVGGRMRGCVCGGGVG